MEFEDTGERRGNKWMRSLLWLQRAQSWGQVKLTLDKGQATVPSNERGEQRQPGCRHIRSGARKAGDMSFWRSLL